MVAPFFIGGMKISFTFISSSWLVQTHQLKAKFNKGEKMKLTRREFFSKSVVGAAVAIAVPSVVSTFLEGCKNNINGPGGSGSGLSNIKASAQNGTITLKIDSSSPISKTGSAAMITYQNGNLLVDHPSSNQFNVLSSICPHQGCLVSEYDSSAKEFVCPCHGSRFSNTGGVDRGPAGYPLTKYQSSFANGELTIKL